jgi:hypothetical protein
VYIFMVDAGAIGTSASREKIVSPRVSETTMTPQRPLLVMVLTALLRADASCETPETVDHGLAGVGAAAFVAVVGALVPVFDAVAAGALLPVFVAVAAGALVPVFVAVAGGALLPAFVVPLVAETGGVAALAALCAGVLFRGARRAASSAAPTSDGIKRP